MKYVFRVVLLAVAAAGLSVGFAQLDTAQHTVTVTVPEVNTISLVGNPIIDEFTVTAGGNLTASDSTSTLSWTTNAAGRKITVATDRGTINFPLEVSTSSTLPSDASTVSVTLSTTAQDFILGIGNTASTVDLTYSVDAPASATSGDEIHLVTYTLTAVL